jgi:signal transduction histidine kinase
VRDVRIRPQLERHRDTLLAGGVALFYCIEIATESGFAGDRPVSFAAALAFAASLAVRRRMPLLAMLAGVGIIEVSNLGAPSLAETGTFLFGFVFALYSCGRYAYGRQAIAGGALTLVAIPLAAIEPGDPVTFTDFAFFVMFFGGPWALGRLLRQREHERDLKAREAVAAERARIARDLHDVVAHAIGVMVLQTRGGRRMLDTDPADTRAALDAIEHAGEQALGEMRRLLGVLRSGEAEQALAPQPSLERLDELAAGLTATGLPVHVSVEGEPIGLPPGIDVCAYRIVQEALTNALKHAGPAHARVTVRYAPSDLELEVLDDGRGNGSGGGSGSGHGLAGIRERVAVYGGALEAGRLPEGGYALRARLPLGEPR